MKHRLYKGIKTKLTESQYLQLDNAERMQYQYNKETKLFELKLGLTKALVKARQKAEKFVLVLVSNLDKRHYLSAVKENYQTDKVPYMLTTERNKAKKFALGFDDEHQKIQRYSFITGLKFETEKLGVKPAETGRVLDERMKKETGYVKGKVKRGRKIKPQKVERYKPKRSVPREDGGKKVEVNVWYDLDPTPEKKSVSKRAIPRGKDNDIGIFEQVPT